VDIIGKDSDTYSTALQGVEVREERGLLNFTEEGGIVVLVNAFLHVSQPLDHARHVLMGLPPGSNSGPLNGLLYVATVMLQSVLDTVASLAQRISKLPGQGNIYFHSYSFVHSEVVWISVLQREINSKRFEGMDFKDYANRVKHEQPWIGAVTDGASGVRDIYDSDGVGYFYKVLLPIYDAGRTIVCRLAKQYGQQVPDFPKL
jgi:hypothetical protein